MIEGEIKVGDRLIECSSGGFYRVLKHDDACGIFDIGKDDSLKSEFGCNAIVLRNQFRRADFGWTRIADRLPGDELEEIIVISIAGHKSFVHRDVWAAFHKKERWNYLRWPGTEYTYWRPIPPDFFPLPIS